MRFIKRGEKVVSNPVKVLEKREPNSRIIPEKKPENNELAVGSYVAIEMMRHGVPYSELPDIRKQVRILMDISNIDDVSFIDGAMINAIRHEDMFLDIEILKYLSDKKYNCPRAVTISSYFDTEIDTIRKYTDENTGCNAFLGYYPAAKFYAFLCASSNYLAGKWENPFAEDMARKHAAKFVKTILIQEIKQYHQEFLKTKTAQKRLYKDFLEKRILPFSQRIQLAVEKGKKDISNMNRALKNAFRGSRIYFSSDPDCNGETYDHVIGDIQNLLSIDAAAGYAAKGVRRWGFDVFMERARALDMPLRETRIGRTKRISVLARIASGRGEKPDPLWFSHIDKGNVFSYRIPLDLQEKMKIQAVSIKTLLSGIEFDMLVEDARQLIKESPLLSGMGAGRPDLELSVFCAICRGLVAGKNFGEEDEGWRAFEALREIKPVGMDISQSAPSA